MQLKSEAGAANIAVCSMFAEAATRRNDVDNANDSVLPSNFPFNSPEAAKYASLDRVHALLQKHREEADAFVHGYMALYQPVHPIIDVAAFSSTVDMFWNDPGSVDASWLATFLMVLALGCLAVSRDQSVAANFCLAAEACLGKTPYMAQPDKSTVRTLCLMVVAKQTANTTCSTFDSCWTFLGVVVRAAVSVGLNTQIRPPPNESPALIHEWQTGQDLWSLVVYFCIQTATVTGKQLLISADDLLTKDMSALGSSSSSEPPPATTTSPWIALLEAYPTICHILARINSTAEHPSYSEVVQYDHQVRRLMVLLGTIRGKPSLHMTLDIFFRRILLALHRLHALDIGAAVDYQVSYWSSLECSLAILVHHRDLCEHEGKQHDNTDLLGRLFKVDFFAAMLTACLFLFRQGAAPLACKNMASLPPRRIILDTLQVCVIVWEREVSHSVCFRIGHMLLSSILTLL